MTYLVLKEGNDKNRLIDCGVNFKYANKVFDSIWFNLDAGESVQLILESNTGKRDIKREKENRSF